MYSTGATGFDVAWGVQFGEDGKAYIAGSTGSADFPVTPGAFSETHGGSIDVFVTRLNPAVDGAGALEWSTLIGSGGVDAVNALALDRWGQPWMVGETRSGDYPLTPDAFDTVCDDGVTCNADFLGEAFVSVLSPDGSTLRLSSFLGGTRGDRANDIDIGPSGSAYVVGLTRSADFPVTPDAFDTTCGTDGTCNGGLTDIFIAQIAAVPPPAVLLHGGSFLPQLAPNTWISIFLTDPVNATTRIWGGPDFVDNGLPETLDGFSVSFNGRPGYISFISPNQFNVLSPVMGVAGSVEVQVATSEGPIDTFTMTADEFAPGFFMFNPQDRRYVAAVHLDGFFVGPGDLFGGAVPTRPAAAGDTIQVFATGFGQTAGGIPEGEILVFNLQRDRLANDVVFQIGESQVVPSFAGLVGAGLYQFNVPIPPLAAGDHSISASVGAFSTQPGTFLAVADVQ